jgi:putative transposase
MIYQKDAEAMTKLLRMVATSYSRYFNKKYHRVGPLFQDRFKASMITSDSYLQHISRYIHLNPVKNYKNYEWSSYKYYAGEKQSGWVVPDRLLELFNDKHEYINFVADYVSFKKMLDELKSELANTY